MGSYIWLKWCFKGGDVEAVTDCGQQVEKQIKSGMGCVCVVLAYFLYITSLSLMIIFISSES